MKIRIFLDLELSNISSFAIKKSFSEYHYLVNVLRILPNDKIFLFNKTEEYLFYIININKNEIFLQKSENFIAKTEFLTKNIALIVAIVKKTKMLQIIQQAVELGVSEIFPVITDFSESESNINFDKIQKIIHESLEQSGGIIQPILHKSQKIFNVIDKLKDNYTLLLGNNFAENNKNIVKKNNKICCIIGPAGGFSEKEINFLTNIENIQSIRIGDRILRTETATVSLLSIANIL